MPKSTTEVIWSENGVPFSKQFDDPYFSIENGLEESRHVFLHGNDLPRRFQDGFHVAELGFGTGLNFLATMLAWHDSGAVGRLRFTSFEAFPLSSEQLWQALSAFPVLSEVGEKLVANWCPEGGTFVFDDVELQLLVGDANLEIRHWNGVADAWYLDGFSPAKNPELWTDAILNEVASHTAIKGTFATYTAAGFVRRALTNAGFEVSRIRGFGRKRHMSTGVLRDEQ